MGEPLMVTDPTRICEILVGLDGVCVRSVDDGGDCLRVHIETLGSRPACHGCQGLMCVKDRDRVELVDLPSFGRPVRLVWHKRRWECPSVDCGVGSFTEIALRIASPKFLMTDRACQWATLQVGKHGR